MLSPREWLYDSCYVIYSTLAQCGMVYEVQCEIVPKKLV